MTTLAACGGIDTQPFEPVACGGDGEPDVVTGLKVSEPFDYIELREFYAGDSSPAEVVQAAGTRCGTAANVGACEAAIAGATLKKGFQLECGQVCPEYGFVINRGDNVAVVDSTAGVLAFLGDIDSASEAVLRARLAGYSVACADAEKGGVVAKGDNFEVLATRITADCDPVETTQYLAQ